MIFMPIFIIVVNQQVEAASPAEPGLVEATCPFCGWHGEYQDEGRAKKALGRHRGHCRGYPIKQLERELSGDQEHIKKHPMPEAQRLLFNNPTRR